MVTPKPRLLVKAKPIPRGASFSIGKIPFQLEPLFATSAKKSAMGVVQASIWHLTEIPSSGAERNVWDLCHQLRSNGFGIAGGPQVEFAEPDIEQQWVYESTARLAAKAFRASAAKDACKKPDAPDSRYPCPAQFDWRWFLEPGFSGLSAARDQIKNPANLKDRVTIAHLDTGYRKGHSVLPEFLDTKLQHSFVEDDPDPNAAFDPEIEGPTNNPGHGTGTLSILAGSLFNGAPFGAPSGVVGGAPFARIIPIRVANSVVQFASSSVARGIEYAMRNNADVLSMSMGGIPSQVWADMVNAAYDAGIVLVTAAGNNFGPDRVRVPRFIVYPARFRRVLAACGVMSDGKPYADFEDPRMMGGSYGPDSKMDTALAAYTPNTAWAKYACTSIVDFDGAGTSAATPQIAAAAACWLQKNRSAVSKYPEPWMRVQAVRKALFDRAGHTNREHFGQGVLHAGLTMNEPPAAPASLSREPPDSIDVPFLGPIFSTIFGAAKPTVTQRMLRIEAAQIVARNGELQNLLVNGNIDPDRPPAKVPAALHGRLVEAMIASPGASNALKSALGQPVRAARPLVPVASDSAPTPAETPRIPAPLTRKLRVFAFDPILRLRVDTESLNQTTLEIPWEKDLQPGPSGEYVEVIDIDPSSNTAYAPVDLNHPHLLASNGLDPAEGVPQFHQQMVYAVAMTTICRFEQALGRTALWAPYMPPAKKGEKFRSYYVPRLRIYPHALREANAYYSPPKKSLLFGYFKARAEDAGDNLPGGLVFCCLSHDVVAHETTHALLDGLHRYYQEQTNPDIAAFHEAFADIVALFQHFTIPEALKHTIAQARGDLKKDNLLAQLAQQFGQASSGSRALRSALQAPAKASDYASAEEAHDRGAVLLAAVFQAFLEIYDARIAGLKRLATSGTGVLPLGDISIDLVNRMAREASIAASHVLTTCIRALDYCPPVDLTYGDYLRALITADMDLEPEDEFNYRTAFISAFRARGIFPSGVRNLSEENLRWQPPNFTFAPERITGMLRSMDLTWNLSSDRQQAFERSRSNGRNLRNWLRNNIKPEEAKVVESDLGIFIKADPSLPPGLARTADGTPIFEVHSVRPARRISTRGQPLIDLVVEIVQRCVRPDPETKAPSSHRGGCTVLVDLQNQRIRYVVRKRVGSNARIRAEQNFLRMAAAGGQAYFDSSKNREPFAMLHRGI